MPACSGIHQNGDLKIRLREWAHHPSLSIENSDIYISVYMISWLSIEEIAIGNVLNFLLFNPAGIIDGREAFLLFKLRYFT